MHSVLPWYVEWGVMIGAFWAILIIIVIPAFGLNAGKRKKWVKNWDINKR